MGPTQGGTRTEVRPARPNDVTMLSKFFVEAWREAGPGAMGFSGATDEAIEEISSPEFLTRRLASPTTYIVVAQEEREIVGFASVRLLREGDSELSGIVVLERARGRGVGTKLLRKAMDGARKRRSLRILAKTEIENRRASAFYKKAGFTESGRAVEKVGRSRVAVLVLVKKLR
ncbi:MAG TPA: GNAT family N-acetyltransferase [Nitrososphaerales archaeon]|nr:GNAT family N-acetyltransferase [Nitrososphaerales archaeon]